MVLVTGASSGIGRESARLFGQAGCKVAVTARRLELLHELAKEIAMSGGEAAVFQADLLQPGSTARLAESVIQTFGKVDILVNNAGFGRLDWLEELAPSEDIQAQLQLNLFSAIDLTRHVIPQMIERGSGTIINIASLASFVAVPMYTIYASSKFGLRGFTDALRREVHSRGVSVTGIYPGFTDTEFIQHVGRLASRGSRTPSWLWLTAEEVAREVVKAATRPRREIILPWFMSFVIGLSKLFPSLTDLIIEILFVKPELEKT